jgi:hypothetical protein
MSERGSINGTTEPETRWRVLQTGAGALASAPPTARAGTHPVQPTRRR